MSIKKVLDYTQKSGVFLYPLLKIKRGVKFVPIKTYLSWEGVISPSDKKLVLLYHLHETTAYQEFEKINLISNPLFERKTIDESGNKVIYIFDLRRTYSYDFNCFLKGKYSLMKEDTKATIKAFYKNNHADLAYLNSFLHPDRYFGLYADLLGVNKNLIEKVGELCNDPCHERETLKILAQNLEVLQTSS